MTIVTIDNLIFHRIAEANKNNEDIIDIRQAMTEGKQSLDYLKLHYYSVYDEVLYYKDRLMIP